MSNRRAPRSTTAPTAGPATSTANPTAVGPTPKATEPLDIEVDYSGGRYLLEYYDAKPRSSRTCVLAFVGEGEKPSSTCKHCARTSLGDSLWEGTLWDSNSARKTPEHQPFVAVTLTESLQGNRQGIVQILADLARKTGYEYGEVREYPNNSEDYTPVFSGSLAELCPSR